MNVLRVTELCKSYPSFTLKNVSFSLEPGEIQGFIGRNGAGKTTTLKALFNLVHPDSGKVEFFGLPFASNELRIKQDVGFVTGGVDYYIHTKLRAITQVTRRFYERWDDDAYRRYCRQFELVETKTPEELSAGMRVKYALALALSHNAKLLVLDEPTSGLDPVSRDDLLEVFLSLADQGISILFSTHITSDLEKTADTITYIQRGQILASGRLPAFVDRYRLISLSDAQLTEAVTPLLIGCKRSKTGHTALLRTQQAEQAAAVGLVPEPATLEDIMVHLEHTEQGELQ